MHGIIQRIESKDYYVYDSEHKIIRCSLRGVMKKEFGLKKDKQYTLDIASVGDRVKFEINEDGTGVINYVEERENYISRKAPRIRGASYRGERLEQIIASNVDNLFIVSSVQSPRFNNKLIDRLVVAAESSFIEPKIILNKIDLEFNELEHWRDLYGAVGIEFFSVSAHSGKGLDELLKAMRRNVNLFWGQSGVGKSSVLNALYPELNLKIGEVSGQTNKGRHTTVTAQALMIENDTFVIDTPGIREIDPYGIRKEELGHYFREFSDFHHDCRFNSCTHHHEPGCRVIEAVADGNVSEERYNSYLNMLESIEDGMNF